MAVWGQEALGLPIHDNWWQTETGGIMIANLAVAYVTAATQERSHGMYCFKAIAWG